MGRSITRAAGACGVGLGLELTVIQVEAEQALKAILNMTQPVTVFGCPWIKFSDRPMLLLQNRQCRVGWVQMWVSQSNMETSSSLVLFLQPALSNCGCRK